MVLQEYLQNLFSLKKTCTDFPVLKQNMLQFLIHQNQFLKVKEYIIVSLITWQIVQSKSFFMHDIHNRTSIHMHSYFSEGM